MVAFKYKYMKESMFRFFRGTCHLFYEDLVQYKDFPTGPNAWISGDLHLENFGSYRSDNKQVYFDLNDFDEAVLAPANWELVRTLASIFVAFGSLKIDEKQAMNMAGLYLKTYVKTLRSGKAEYVEARSARGVVRDFLQSAERRKQSELLLKRTEVRKNKLGMQVNESRLYKLDKPLKRELLDHAAEWLRHDEFSPYNYKPVDVVFRLAGTGSAGINRYAFLLRSRNDVGQEYIIVDMKQALASSLAPYLSVPQPDWDSEAARVVTVQRIMQNRSAALVSTSFFRGESYVMQEMQPSEDSIHFDLIKDRYRDMYAVLERMGILAASSALRSSGRKGSATADDLINFANDETWQETVLQYALVYSRKVERDFTQFSADYKSGAFLQTD